MLEISKERKEIISRYSLPTYKEIPSVGLYLDQTSKYINECLKPIMDVEITNSMISNYVKKHLIANPIKKQYYREQIANLIFIALTKYVLSLDNVHRILKRQREVSDHEESYNCFKDYFNDYLHQIFEGKETKKIDDKDESKALLKNIVITIVRQIYLEELLRQY